MVVKIRAPRESGETVCVPSLEVAAQRIDEHRAQLATAKNSIFGRSLRQLADQARDEFLQAAWRYTHVYLPEAPRPAAKSRIVLTGHQPELFHPGVWLKNFANDRLAKSTDAVGVHLIIDGDLARQNSVRVPTLMEEGLLVVPVEFDCFEQVLPYEERRVQDAETFARFPDRLAETLTGLVDQPFAQEFWPRVQELLPMLNTPSLAAAAARHRWEWQHGLRTLELPQSAMCELPTFQSLAAWVLRHAGDFLLAHNAATARFRSEHKIRNPAQPVPDLVQDDGWNETPLWVWRKDDPTRRRLFARLSDEGVTLRNDAGWQVAIAVHANCDPDEAAAALGRLAEQGIKIRSRALLTTLFARLFLSDIFIHGIGGARYDEVTDEIVRQWIGIEPPHYCTVTGTLLLDVDSPRDSQSRIRELKQRLRSLRYHPEMHVTELPLGDDKALMREAGRWVVAKQGAYSREKTPENAKQRHNSIEEANHELGRLLAPLREATVQDLAQAKRDLRREQILRSREYAFCLFPEEQLRSILNSFNLRRKA